MEIKEINFKKSKTYDNGCQVEFEFAGVPKNENINLDKVRILLGRFMKKYHDDMAVDVASIRTILREFDEKLLTISYSETNGNKENVQYDNGNLSSYQTSKKDVSNKCQVDVQYNSKSNVDLSFKEINGDIIDSLNSMNQVTKDISKKIYDLRDIKAIEMNDDAKILAEMYKIFYNENPDFSDSNINNRIQAMMIILSSLSWISLGRDYRFNWIPEQNKPVSTGLNNLVDKMFPLGEIVNVDNEFKLSDETVKRVRVIGESINEAMENAPDKEEVLMTISKVIYAEYYLVPNNYFINDLSRTVNCSEEKVESSLKLVRQIKRKIK